MTNKLKPTHDLDNFKAWAQSPAFSVAGSALKTAAEIGFGSADMASIIQTMARDHFYKSMTSQFNHREWQDVYHVPSDAGVIYIKFRDDVVTEFLLLSFKEKDNG